MYKVGLINRIKELNDKEPWNHLFDIDGIKTIDNQYLHDNFDIQTPFKKFSYTFDFHTIDIRAVSVISAAGADKYGNYSIIMQELNF